MPVNELEQHPFINYQDELIPPSIINYKSLIIGSFPVYAVTDSVNQNFQVVTNRFRLEKAKFKFFYGSKKSDFWKLVSSSLNGEDPTDSLPPFDYNLRKQNAISLLERNKILITDSIYRTNRIEERDEDKNLMITNPPCFASNNLQLNDINNLLERYPSIETLYFTSTMINEKSPFGWFIQGLGENLIGNPVWRANGGRGWYSEININGRIYSSFLLPTPKARGVHFSNNRRLEMFCNYMESVDHQFYNEIFGILENERTEIQSNRLSQLRMGFLVECYRQALVYKNPEFNGTINH
ncbi:MAG: hypothetical protein KF775_17530 [Cyclobacteriaceae bacterium]|nr:hypothetical protein [Cyclobacteriaceae bacterium]